MATACSLLYIHVHDQAIHIHHTHTPLLPLPAARRQRVGPRHVRLRRRREHHRGGRRHDVPPVQRRQRLHVGMFALHVREVVRLAAHAEVAVQGVGHQPCVLREWVARLPRPHALRLAQRGRRGPVRVPLAQHGDGEGLVRRDALALGRVEGDELTARHGLAGAGALTARECAAAAAERVVEAAARALRGLAVDAHQRGARHLPRVVLLQGRPGLLHRLHAPVVDPGEVAHVRVGCDVAHVRRVLEGLGEVVLLEGRGHHAALHEVVYELVEGQPRLARRLGLRVARLEVSQRVDHRRVAAVAEEDALHLRREDGVLAGVVRVERRHGAGLLSRYKTMVFYLVSAIVSPKERKREKEKEETALVLEQKRLEKRETSIYIYIYSRVYDHRDVSFFFQMCVWRQQ
ncbi:hypothetical protein STCU_05445 [Strigomonas culicis]|uniref:Uncharacterized protein n=1 Tax=Strigomonas culicis TaxID=28005 RepID=S9UG38_9TRYP|nr:hypothetical protein STCU_05445 [Strigomonas culicis]|eukprot:EPY27893.1 hypothetical protein STCU_05445 [Strigomonas culicis]